MTTERLAEILEGVSRSDFLSEHYEQKLLVIRQRAKSRLEFGLNDFEDLLSLPGVRPLLRIVKEQNEDSNPAAVTESGHVNKQYLLGVVNRGYTLVLNDIHRLDARLQELAAELGWELGCYCAVNAYLTPASSQALKPHFDSHDIFAIQCHGTKVWNVQSGPTELPTLSTHQPVLENVEQIAMTEIELRKGDVMYLPRGTVHYATTRGSSSLHLTIGLYPIEWREMIGAIVEESATSLHSLRRSVPIGKRREGDMDLIKMTLQTISQQASEEELTRALARVEKSLLRRQPQPMRGSLASTIQSLEQEENSSLNLRVKRCREPVSVEMGPRGARLEMAGFGFTIPLASQEMVRELLRDDEPFTVRDRVGTHDPIAQIVAETLISRGILRIIDTEEDIQKR